MFIDYPTGAGFVSFFATHPPIESRIEALVRYAGGLDLPVHPELPPAAPPPQIDSGPGPRGRRRRGEPGHGADPRDAARARGLYRARNLSRRSGDGGG